MLAMIPGITEEKVVEAVDFEPLMREVAEARADKERADAVAEAAKIRLESAEWAMMRGIERSGMPEGGSVSGHGLRFKIENKARATYDPQKWEDILRIASQGMGGLVQRRLNVKILEEMVEAGQALPEGTRIEYQRELSVRKA